MSQDNKNVTIERKKFTKTEKQYLRGIIQNLSLQRLTDQEIVDYLQREKKIEISRSTATKIRNKVVEEAGNWYLELRESGYRTIAFYKERLDSLLSYQKKLNEIMDYAVAPEIRIRAIAELHRIEMSLHTIFQELPHEQFQIKPQIEQEPKHCYCHNCLPGFGGEGAGPLVTVEQPFPKPKPSNELKPIIATQHSSPIQEQELEEEEEEQETESERYWRMRPVKKRNSNEVYYPRRRQEEEDDD